MLVTINTDASFRDDLRIGTFSFWMVCNEGRHFGAGRLKGDIHSCNEAEFKAILNALHFLHSHSGWAGIKKIIINTDSHACLLMINGGETHRLAKTLKPALNKIVRELGVEIEARKVKAHSGTSEKRKFVNHWCDRQAKHLLRTIIKNES